MAKPVSPARAAGFTQPILDRLLGWLHPDRELAGVRYEELRIKLMRFLKTQGCPDFEDCADATLVRVGRKLVEGTEIQTTEPYEYARGVARFVLLEYWRKQEPEQAFLDDLPPGKHPALDPEKLAQTEAERLGREQKLTCLERCLDDLPPESRHLFLAYHREADGPRIDHRAQLAEALGIDVTALRTRVSRLRAKLEACISTCLKHRAASNPHE